MGIAKSLLNRRANCSPAQSGIYLDMRTLVRHRRKLVEITTEVKNRIHAVVDRLFPGFLNESKSGITPFSKSSLWLMQERFSAWQIRRRRRTSLIEALRQRGTKKPEDTADKLQQYASQVLKPPQVHVHMLQLSLAQHVKHFCCLQEGIGQLETEIALNLAQTQGAFLTSVRGIGIVLAAGVSAEIGNPFEQKPINNLVSYSGIIPRVKQTGGPQGKTKTGKVARRCNRILKDYVVRSASHLGLYGPADLKSDYQRRQAATQHADFGMGRRYLRIAMCLMRTSQIYLPSQLRNAQSQIEDRADYYVMSWPQLRDKWRKSGALQTAFSPDQPLGQWRKIVQQFYGIKLTL